MPEARVRAAAAAAMPSSPGISTSSSATSAERCARGIHDLVAAADLRHHLQIGFEVEQGGEGAAHQRLVVGEQQPDGSVTRSPSAR